MADFRAKARIPFGYRIVDGKAQIDPVESAQLKKYFSLYLGGLSMAEAAKEAEKEEETNPFAAIRDSLDRIERDIAETIAENRVENV